MYDTGGEAALQEVSRSKPILKNRVEPSIEAAVVKMAFDYPAFGQQRASNELRKQDVFISAGGIRSVWLRHNLEVFDKRLKALEVRVAQEGLILTEAQVVAMDRKQERREARESLNTRNMSYIFRSRVLSIAKPRSATLKQMVSASVFIVPCRMSSTPLRSERSYTPAWNKCKPTLTNG